MRSKSILVVVMVVCVMVLANVASATTDTFGTGANQFTIDFVPISGSTNPTSGYGIVNNDYRMGTYEITNDQWNKFVNAYGTVTGSPSSAYDESASWTGTDPTHELSWYEAAQFVNWLNTSTGHQAAYKFTGTQGTGNYTLGVWESGDAGYDSSNPFRNSNAYYFLPTEDEWVKAAYWNGTSLQTYATTDDSVPVAGDDTNYNDVIGGPWDVGSGSEELNNTFDMMGNVWEWMESPYYSGNYLSGSDRGIRGGAFNYYGGNYLSSSTRNNYNPSFESFGVGFRVASIPELAFEVEVEIAPHTLNVQSKGKWINCHVWMPEEYDVADVNSSSIVLEDEIGAMQVWTNEEEQFVMAKFPRLELQQLLIEFELLGDVELLVSGELIDGMRFEGTAVIRVIDKGGKE